MRGFLQLLKLTLKRVYLNLYDKTFYYVYLHWVFNVKLLENQCYFQLNQNQIFGGFGGSQVHPGLCSTILFSLISFLPFLALAATGAMVTHKRTIEKIHIILFLIARSFLYY